jgi:3-oxoacyl-[acyl-carrier-protein] synthase-3
VSYATITGTGIYVPERILPNAELTEMLGEDIDDFVSNVLGIRERRIAAPGESTVDLAEPAARRAVATAGLDVADIDLLIVCTDTPEQISPSTAATLHGRLGLQGAGAFDINAACAGFATGLDVASRYAQSGDPYRHVLLVSVYAMTKFVDYTDRTTATMFADGAGAVVVEASETPGVLASELYADGTYCDRMGIFAGGTAEPITEAVLASGERNHLRFVAKYPASVNEEGWPRIARSTLDRAGFTPDDVDLWFWTQVNRSTIWTVMDRLGVPRDRAWTIMDKWGYTGSACLPMALHDAIEKGAVSPGDLLYFTGSGAGLSMGAVVMRWTGVPAERQSGDGRTGAAAE